MKKLVFYLMAGIVLLTAACGDDESKTEVAATGIKLSYSDMSIVVGTHGYVQATVEPEAASRANLKWESSDPSVATVTNGLINALKVGKTKIRVSAEANTGISAECNVEVTSDIVELTGISIGDNAAWECVEGDEKELKVTFSPPNATNKEVKWSSSDPAVSIEEVNATTVRLVVLPGAAGKTITVTVTSTAGNHTTTCEVTVLTVPVSKITLSPAALILDAGKDSVFTATFAPTNATNKAVTWTSDNALITVTPDPETPYKATVAALAGSEGKMAIIRATSDENSEIFAECTVTVPNYAAMTATYEAADDDNAADIAAAISLRLAGAGYKDITVKFAAGKTYTIGGDIQIPNGVNNITFTGDAGNMPQLENARFRFAGKINNLTVKDLSITGGGSQIVHIENGRTVNNILFENCKLQTFQNVVAATANGATAKDVLLNNCLITNASSWGIFRVTNGTPVSVIASMSVTNSTIFNMGERFGEIMIQTSILFKNNTFCNLKPLNNLNHFWRFESTALSVVTTVNCIFAANYQTNGTTLQNVNSTYGAHNILPRYDANNYITSDFTENTARPLVGVNKLSLDTYQLFVDPANGDFHIKPGASFAGKGTAGDPRWF